jgi:hypothetical protein
MKSNCRANLRWLLAGLMLLAVLHGGCQGQIFKRGDKKAQKRSDISKEEVRSALNDFVELYIAEIKQASEQLDTIITTTKTRKLTLVWRLRASQALFDVSAQEDAIAAFLDTWTLCVRMSAYFEHGNGSESFGEHQAIATNATSTLEREVERIAHTFLDEAAFTKAKTFIHSLSAKNPIRGAYSFNMVYASKSTDGGQNPLQDVISLPMAPFRALEGVDKGAMAMHRFTDTAERITDIVELLPESMRWQMLLLLFEMEETDLVRNVLANMDTVSESSSRLADAADKLPEKFREQASLLIDEIDQKQANLQVTLDKAEKATATVERTVVQIDKAAETIDQSAQSLTQTAEAWEGTIVATEQMVKAFSKDKPPKQEPSKPFDIQEYKATIEATTAAAEQLHSLVAEVHATIESDHLSQRIDDVNDKGIALVKQTAMEAQQLANILTWRLAGLIVLFFALAFAYRLVLSKCLTFKTSE